MTRAEIDLGALRHNARALRQLAGEADLVGVVKADAYGHGATACAKALVDEGVEWLAVAAVGEGQALREAGVGVPILVFAAPLPHQLDAYARHDLRVAVSSAAAAQAVIASGLALVAHVKVDTGMHRLGVPPEATAATVRALQAAPHVEVEGVWTHLATADESDTSFVDEQLERFQRALDGLGPDAPPIVHVANGPALVRGLASAGVGSRRQLVRAGGVLYGLASSLSLARDVERHGLRPVMRLASSVVHLQTVAPGESVSYGRTWTARRPTRVATVAAGYADGLARAYAGPVGVGEGRYPVVGRVCMDMLLVDLGGPGGPGSSVRIGDDAVLFGPGGPTAEQAADAAGTISYELTSGLTARVPRIEPV